jgi:hypothetical protein
MLDLHSNTHLAIFRLSVPGKTLPPFVFHRSRTLPFLGYHPTPSLSVACAVLYKNTGGTPFAGSWALGTGHLSVTPSFPPLMRTPSRNSFPCHSYRKDREAGVVGVRYVSFPLPPTGLLKTGSLPTPFSRFNFRVSPSDCGNYCGYCLTVVTFSPVKCTKIVLSGGCP